MQTRRLPILLAAAVLAACELIVSDVATRIRYALRDAEAELRKSGKETLTIALRPNHMPDSCGSSASYRLTLSPYKGDKQVATGDIDVLCKGTRHYYTGMGSEGIYVTRVIVVEKKADDEVRVTLRRTARGTEIVAVE